MSSQNMTSLEGPIFDRFSKETRTCYGKEYKSAVYGFFNQFQDSYFYTNCIQFIIVLLMYLNVGKGRYWQILFYASISGLLGGFFENATVAYICQDSQAGKNYKVIPFFIDEIFWMICEYAIPLLNLIKMKAFSKGKMVTIVYYIIIGLGIPFAFFRLAIGFERMNKGYLQSGKIGKLHGYAFFIMAIADLICTVFILYFVRKHNSMQAFSTSKISNYIKHSSYTILVTVDVVGFSLSILNILTISGLCSSFLPETIVTPFHCLKSSFVLILASDALIFKYDANTSSLRASSGSNSRLPSNPNDGFSGNSKTSMFKGNAFTVDMNKSLNNNNYQSLTPNSNVTFNYASTLFSGTSGTNTNKTIIKNYTSNIKTSPSPMYMTSPDSEKTYSPQYNF